MSHLRFLVRIEKPLSASRGDLMNPFYFLMRTSSEFPNVHQPEVPMNVYSGDFLRFAMAIVGEGHIWYVPTRWTRYRHRGKQPSKNNAVAGINDHKQELRAKHGLNSTYFLTRGASSHPVVA